jgi:hypothetical protein
MSSGFPEVEKPLESELPNEPGWNPEVEEDDGQEEAPGIIAGCPKESQYHHSAV